MGGKPCCESQPDFGEFCAVGVRASPSVFIKEQTPPQQASGAQSPRDGGPARGVPGRVSQSGDAICSSSGWCAPRRQNPEASAGGGDRSSASPAGGGSSGGQKSASRDNLLSSTSFPPGDETKPFDVDKLPLLDRAPSDVRKGTLAHVSMGTESFARLRRDSSATEAERTTRSTASNGRQASDRERSNDKEQSSREGQGQRPTVVSAAAKTQVADKDRPPSLDVALLEKKLLALAASREREAAGS